MYGDLVDLVSDDSFSGSTIDDEDSSEERGVDEDMLEEDNEDRFAIHVVNINENKKYQIVFPGFGDSPSFKLRSKNLKTLEEALFERIRQMKELFNKHMKRDLTCQVCWQAHPDLQTYLQHILICPVICKECGELFQTKEEEAVHFKSHTLKEPIAPRPKECVAKKSKKNCSCVFCS